jgi:hypothetical protein
MCIIITRMFDESSGEALTTETHEAFLRGFLRSFESRYFAGVLPVEDLSLQAPPEGGPACLYLNVVRIDPGVAPFYKLCKILILHELIHHKLLISDGDADENEGERFQAEVERLQNEGAYARLF